MSNNDYPYSQKLRARLSPEHLADLAKSGLSEATISAAQLRSIPRQEVAKHLGFYDARIKSVLCFPYLGVDGFCRDKIFPPIEDKPGHASKYRQRTGSAAELYVPELSRETLNRHGETILIAEGEKKALKACQDEIPTLAIGGVWNGFNQHKLIDGLAGIDWRERPTFLAPDSDVWKRDDLLRAVVALGKELARRGARVTIFRIPDSGGEKIGLDDFLVARGRAALSTLEEVQLTDARLAKLSAWEERWHARHNPVEIAPTPRVTAGDALLFPPAAVTGPFARWLEIVGPCTEAPDDYHWAVLLIQLGLMLGRRVYVENPHRLYGNFYVLLIGPAGRNKKSTCLRFGELLSEAMDDDIMTISTPASLEGIYKELARHDDTKALIYQDEFAGLLAAAHRGATGNILSGLNTLHACPPEASITRKESTRIVNPIVSLLTGAPQAWIEEVFEAGDFDSGFMSRVMILTGTRKEPKPRPPAPDREAIVKFAAELKSIVDALPPHGHAMGWSDRADDLYKTWYVEREHRLDQASDREVSLTARIADYVVKIAMIYSVLEKSQEITGPAMTIALSIGDYLHASALRLFGEVAFSRQGRLEERIVKMLTGQPMTRRDIRRNLGGRYNTTEMNKALDEMVKAERIGACTITRQNGQHSPAYRLL